MNKNIFIGVVLCAVVANAWYLFSIYQNTYSAHALEDHPYITALADTTGDAIAKQVGTLITPTLFSQPMEKNKTTFETLFTRLRSDEVFRIKVWDTKSTVLWSDADELTGKRFPENDKVQAVFSTGQRKIEMKLDATGGSDKTELLTESFYNNYMETYYPIRGNDGAVVGIVEVYQVVNAPLARIRAAMYRKGAMTIGGTLVFMVLLAYVFWKTTVRSAR